MFDLETITKFISNPEIIAIPLTFLSKYFLSLLQGKPKMIWGFKHQFLHSVPQREGGYCSIYTKSILFKNLGRKAAKNLELYFSFKPEHFQIWPPIEFKTDTIEDSKFVIKIPFIKSQEFFSIEFLQSVNAPPDLLNTRIEVGTCNETLIYPEKVFPTWLLRSIAALILVGAYQVFVWLLYLALKFLSF